MFSDNTGFVPGAYTLSGGVNTQWVNNAICKSFAFWMHNDMTVLLSTFE